MPRNDHHRIFDHQSYEEQYVRDWQSVRGRAIIQSPYVTLRRTQLLFPHIEAAARRGVHCDVIILHQSDEKRMEEPQAAMRMLAAIGVHSQVRHDIHEKICVFDEDILWEGSLNYLSHSRNSERLNRWRDREMVTEAVRLHGLDFCVDSWRNKAPDDSRSFQADQRALVGRALLERRKLLGLSQREVAMMSGLPQNTVSRIEAGKRNAGVDTICRLCEVLNLEFRMTPTFLRSPVDKLLKPASDHHDVF
jgi:DNA-binding XRE family transcriptional regulator